MPAHPKKIKSSSCGSAKEVKITVTTEDEGHQETLQQNSLQTAMSKAKTRAEVANLYKNNPPVASRRQSEVKVAHEKASRSNPYCLAQRPCESDIEKAEKMLLAANVSS